MRAICLALVILNLLVFGAQMLLGPEGLEAEVVENAQPQTLEARSDLRLLSERVAVEQTSATEERKLKSMTEPERLANLPEQPLCLLIGPFGDQELAQSLMQRLEALDLQPRLENLEVPEDPGYWVYLPPELSQKAALRRLHELQSKNIDSYIIPRGELALGISLGMFSQDVLARQRRQELETQGYDAKIQEISRSHRETWVSLPSSHAAQVAEQFWSEFFNQHPGLDKRQNFCPGVASGTNFH